MNDELFTFKFFCQKYNWDGKLGSVINFRSVCLCCRGFVSLSNSSVKLICILETKQIWLDSKKIIILLKPTRLLVLNLLTCKMLNQLHSSRIVLQQLWLMFRSELFSFKRNPTFSNLLVKVSVKNHKKAFSSYNLKHDSYKVRKMIYLGHLKT